MSNIIGLFVFMIIKDRTKSSQARAAELRLQSIDLFSFAFCIFFKSNKQSDATNKAISGGVDNGKSLIKIEAERLRGLRPFPLFQFHLKL